METTDPAFFRKALEYISNENKLCFDNLLEKHKKENPLKEKSNTKLVRLLIFKAVECRQVDILHSLIKMNLDVNFPFGEKDETPLHMAALIGFLDSCKLLVEEGLADINTINKFGDTPLHYAIMNYNPGISDYFLSKGANPRIAGSEGTPVHFLTKENNRSSVGMLRLLSKYKIDVTRGHPHISSLMNTCDSPETLEYLCSVTNDINERDDNGMTALHHACIQGRLEKCKILARHGAMINSVDKTGISILHSALIHRHLDIFEFLIRNGAEAHPSGSCYHVFNQACKYPAYHKTVQFLVENSYMDINEPILDDRHFPINSVSPLISPLSSAVCSGCYETVKYLLEKGANQNTTSFDGWTLLYQAAYYDRADICELLCKGFYLNVDIKNESGFTAIHGASRSNSWHSMETLIKLGANLNLVTEPRYSALSDICEKGNTKMCQMMLDAGAKFDVSESFGNNPLLLAMFYKHKDIVELLINHTVITDECIEEAVKNNKIYHHYTLDIDINFLKNEKKKRDCKVFMDIMCERAFNENSPFFKEKLPLDLLKDEILPRARIPALFGEGQVYLKKRKTEVVVDEE